MPNYRRPRVPGATVFFTVCLAERDSRLLVDRVDLLREAVRVTKARRPFRIDAWVVLPDHMHAVWTLPENDANFSDRWGAIKARFSRHVRLAGAAPDGHAVGCKPTLRCGERTAQERRVGLQTTDAGPTRATPAYRYPPRSPSKVSKGEAGIWQRRFWEHHVRCDEDRAACIRYCHIDPVKHALVGAPEAWPYSSVHREIREGRWP